MVEHKRTRTMTMSWEGLSVIDDDDDDDFYDSNNRISSVVPFDMAVGPAHSSEDSSDDDDDDDAFEDPSMSFVSSSSSEGAPPAGLSSPASPAQEDYDMWLVTPASISERRRKLFKGMGLNSSKQLLRLSSMAMSKKFADPVIRKDEKEELPAPAPAKEDHAPVRGGGDEHAPEKERECRGRAGSPSPSPDTPLVLIRSRSEGDIDPFSVETKRRKEQLIGNVSKQRLTRTSSTLLVPCTRACNSNEDNNNNSNQHENNITMKTNSTNNNNNNNNSRSSSGRRVASSNNQHQISEELGAFFLIKNLDTGKEFIVKEFANDGMWNRLSDLQTGKQLTMEEFEKSVGYSPVVKELMRRHGMEEEREREGGGAPTHALERKTSVNAFLSKRFRFSKRRGASLLKNINSRVTQHLGSISENKEKENQNHSSPRKAGKNVNEPTAQTQNKEWVRVRSQGKTYKELTALRFCQEIQGAHQGSIWTIKFNPDGRFLASAGEDKVIHIWEVQECEIANSLKPPEVSANSTPLHPMFSSSLDRGGAPDMSTLDKKKKGKSASRRSSGGNDVMPDYVRLPESLFALSNEPVCSFEGHLDDVLDLSWSTTQLLLLSSSMDKTVRLWDLEKKACLRLFAHNDYVTCIQFNPLNDDYFISGSLDAKIRIWNVPERRVVDWTDLHEMVTAACYTPDGQGAIVGSHKGNIRTYNINDGKLNQTSQFVIQTKKKSGPKKITGFQFTADNPNEVLVTSADSRVRIYEGSEMTQKFKGFRNTSSQIAASFSTNGKYVICASEDSHVYVWKREESKNGKSKAIIRTNSHEYFACKDVSVATPWPGSLKFEPPIVQLHSKRHHSKRQSSLVLPFSPRKDDANNKNSKKHHHLPPLPNNKKEPNPIEKTNNNNENNKSDDNINGDTEKGPKSPECDSARIARSDSGSSDSFNSTGAGGSSLRHGVDSSPSITSNSGSRAPGWSWFDGGGSHGTMQARAWGLVIVTAGLGGEIRAYQNIGIPLKVGRQASLLR